MCALFRQYPYGKAVMLNVLYDALDGLGGSIDTSNSTQGVLLISTGARENERLRITMQPNLSGKRTLIEVFPEDAEAADGEWVSVLFDEMSAVIKRAEMKAAK